MDGQRPDRFLGPKPGGEGTGEVALGGDVALRSDQQGRDVGLAHGERRLFQRDAGWDGHGRAVGEVPDG